MTNAGRGDSALVAGIDSSTQSCKIIVCEAGTGRIVRTSRAPHPATTEVSAGSAAAEINEHYHTTLHAHFTS